MSPSATKKTYTVVCDPGHWGDDVGAVYNGIREADLVSAYASELQADLERRGHAVTATRGASIPTKKLMLHERGAISKRAGADFVVSLHANAAVFPDSGKPNELAMGAIVFYHPASALARKLATEIEFRMPAKLRTRRVRVEAATKEAWPRVFSCLDVHAAPSVLLEIGFLTNKDDAFMLSQPETIRQVVSAIGEGIDVMGRPEAQIP